MSPLGETSSITSPSWFDPEVRKPYPFRPLDSESSMPPCLGWAMASSPPEGWRRGLGGPPGLPPFMFASLGFAMVRFDRSDSPTSGYKLLVCFGPALAWPMFGNSM